MGYPNSENFKKLLTLNEAALELGVTIDSLIEWNDLNILKPTISLTGEVGYTQEQIDKFRAIRELAFGLRSASKIGLNPDQNIETSNEAQDKIMVPVRSESSVKPVIESINLKQEEAVVLIQNSHKFFSAGPILSLFAVAIPLIIIIIMQQGKLTPIINFLTQQRDEGVKSALISEANKVNLADLVPLPTQAKEKSLSENSLKKSNANTLSNAFNVNSKNTATTAASGKIAQKDPVNAKTASVAGSMSSIGYSDRGNLLAGSKSSDSLFDERGNIKGETGKSDILAMNFEAVREIVKDKSLKQGSNYNAIIVLFGLGLVSLIFILRKQAPVAMKAAAATNSPIEEKIIMNISQKTDGAVVLCHEGKEYKICKPDMDSESDQFIERLMGFTASNIREFDYDTTVDSQVSFNAPLSKLVTRLGFVGLKRDLFFPRTSKNSVLFRRYITERDLVSINISPDQILKEVSTTG